MRKVFLVLTFMTHLTISGCQFDTFHYYKDEVAELTMDPNSRKLQEIANNLNDLNGCEFLLKIDEWKKSKWDNSFSRHESWRKETMYHGSGVSLDPSTKYFKNIKMALQDNKIYPIYIGPWHHSPRINKTIRFFAYTGIGGGEIQYQYESQTKENKNIPEKPFSLPPNLKIAPDRFGLCVVKWTARFGYNAVAEVEYKGFFNKIFRLSPTPTGKIIEVKE